MIKLNKRKRGNVDICTNWNTSKLSWEGRNIKPKSSPREQQQAQGYLFTNTRYIRILTVDIVTFAPGRSVVKNLKYFDRMEETQHSSCLFCLEEVWLFLHMDLLQKQREADHQI